MSVAAAYSATGAAWDDGPGRIYERLATVLVEQSPTPLAGRLVVDVGAGTGAASRAIARAGGSPVAVDVAPGMLGVDRRNRPPALVADARRLPFAAGSCGGVVAAFCYNHLPDPVPALAEARRVLRPGGVLLASAYALEDAHPVTTAVDQAAREHGWEPDPWVVDVRAVAMPRLATVERAAQACAAAGLGAQVQVVEVGFPDLGPAQLVAWRMGMAQVAPFLARLGPDRRERVAARAIELLGVAPVLVRRVVAVTAQA